MSPTVSVHRRASARLVAILVALAVAMIAAAVAGAASDAITAVEGTSFQGQVGTGGAQCPAQMTNLQITITWGEGTTSAGTGTVSGNVITVSGIHTDQQAGSYSGRFTGRTAAAANRVRRSLGRSPPRCPTRH